MMDKKFDKIISLPYLRSMDNNKFGIAYLAVVLPAGIGLLALTFSDNAKHASITPQEVNPDAAFCTFDASNRTLKIIAAGSKETLLEKSMPRFGEGTLEAKDGPFYAQGTTYTIDFNAATCFVDDFYRDKKLVYKLLKNDPTHQP